MKTATRKGFFRTLAADLQDRHPVHRREHRRHFDGALPIDLQYDDGFHRDRGRAPADGGPRAASFAASRDPLGGAFGGTAPFTVEAFEDEDEEQGVVYGAGELEEEDESTLAPGSYASSASRSVSFGESDEELRVWGTGELDSLENLTESVASSLSDDGAAPVWGTGELAQVDAEIPDGAAPESPPPSEADVDVRRRATPATGGADLAAATFSRIARDTQDPETLAFANDLQAILAGQKAHPSTQEPVPATDAAEEKEPLPPLDQRPVSAGYTHADFEKWGAARRKLSAAASTFDQGSFDVSRQLDAFDGELDAAERRSQRRAARAEAASNPRQEFAEDMSALRQAPVAPPPLPPEPPVARAPFPTPPSVSPSPVTVRPESMSTEIPLDPGTGGISIDERMLQVGDLVLSTTGAVSSWIIRAGTGAPVSHSMVYIGDGQVVEAVAQGVVLRSLADAVSDATTAVAFRKPGLTPEQGAMVRDFVGQQVGKPYNKMGIVRQAGYQLDRAVFCSGKTGEALDRCLNWVGHVNLGTSDDSTFFCSELVVAAFANAGAPLTATPPNWTSPGDLAELRLSGRLSYVGHLKAPPLTP
jgi:uncharacterized protein YycO